MRVDVVFLPRDLRNDQLENRAVAVLDVLRATTTMIAALSNGAKEVRVFDSLEAARNAAESFGAPSRVLCGELRCLPAPGFDIGNSPGDFSASRVGGKTLFMSTTNGTRAIVAARRAEKIFVAALVNARATALALAATQLDVTLLCSGTDGEFSYEDVIGAGAIIDALQSTSNATLASDAEIIAKELNASACRDYSSALRRGAGGRGIDRRYRLRRPARLHPRCGDRA